VAADGPTLYQQHCAACHGPTGTGDGPGARYLYPKPRDFSRGLFKVRSTPDGKLPTDDDLLRTLTQGMPGSPMPAFGYLSAADRQALVAHVKSLVTRQMDAAPEPIAVGQEPAPTPATIAEGKTLYTKMGCFQCHGHTGKGDGPSAATMKDSWGYPIAVRDFTTGVNGTPMPSYQEQLTDEQRWALVHYVQSLRVSHEEFIAPAGHLIVAKRGSLAEATDYQIPMMMLWPCPQPLAGIHVRAAHDGKQIRFQLEWAAPRPSHAAVGQQEFRDGAAVQFPLDQSYPFLGMGEKDKPVNVWHWKSDWQAEVAGQRRDIRDAYPAMHVDMYPRSEPIFITARAAGNALAAEKRTSPVEDLNAAGFGSTTTQPAASQNVSGTGVWQDGKWRVTFVRDLTSADPLDRRFTVGETIPVSFAVWRGEHGDRNGQKAVSTWFNLKLEN
jgi:mono/diheme cytochrome c family protein